MKSQSARPTETGAGAADHAAFGLQTSGQPGDLISSRRESLLLDAHAWMVTYRSTTALGEPNAVSGTVLVPHGAWRGPGPRPIVAFAHGTVGITDDCAPSKTMASEIYDTEEFGVMKALSRGWAVALTDYEGLGTPGNHTYVVAISEAHAVLDSVRAAMQTPGSGLDKSAPVVIWGYSQGGGAAAAAAEAAPMYAPELQVKGVAAGGVPADLSAVAANLEGNFFYGLLLAASLGLDTAYPELNLGASLNATGRAELEAIENGTKGGCVDDLTINFAFKHTSDYTTSNPLTTPAWQRRITENKLGIRKPAVPAFLYHGDIDEIIPLAVGEGLRDRWCQLGATVRWSVYPFGEHDLAASLAEDDAIRWISDRFAGKAAPNDCKT